MLPPPESWALRRLLWSCGLFLRLIPKDVLATMPYLQSIGLNPRVLGFAAMVTLAAGVLFSLLPALRVSLSDLREGLTAERSRLLRHGLAPLRLEPRHH